MKKLILTQSLTVALTAFTFSAQAQLMTANQGLDKIKTNLENAKSNQKEYDRNIEIVNKNIKEVSKAKDIYAKQKEVVSSEIVKNNDSLKKVISQEREIASLIEKEKEKISAETKQLEKLEHMITQIKMNKVQRESLIADYQNQLRIATEEKKSWKDREAELRTHEAKTIQSVRSLASEEATWSNKRKGYEGEKKRWVAEADKQQKIHDTYKGLAEQGK